MKDWTGDANSVVRTLGSFLWAVVREIRRPF